MLRGLKRAIHLSHFSKGRESAGAKELSIH